MDKRIVYTGTFPDGTQLMVERFVTDDGFGRIIDVAMYAARRNKADPGIVWGSPIALTEGATDGA